MLTRLYGADERGRTGGRGVQIDADDDVVEKIYDEVNLQKFIRLRERQGEVSNLKPCA
jgi:glutaredoxin-related protein